MTDQILSSTERAQPVSRIVRQTYTLLGIVMAVAAAGAGAGLAVGLGWSIGMWLVFMVVFIGGPFAIDRAKSGDAAIYMTIAWAGLVGFLLSPMVGHYLAMKGGTGIVLNALGATAVLFFALSGYALVSRKDFSFMAGFLIVGLLVVLLAIVANIFFQVPAFSLAISGAAVLLMCGMILYDTSRMIHDGASNCVTITVSLFANITVLFSHLLRIFAFLGGDD